ncbi:MAG: riboflavin kinase / FMN adenylyltransferase [Candidatus Peregrinibacteria bacterium Greene0416_62]|nr:MAG: riboflavin kinase / FMN adenylyltransferase [Candidatus Peregrinibacteria bacterium Greene0416_62]TSD00012.1 MAG: riboflavin kinase / FMN adenylyltransferase [Candidatus Peregrinibacteria bacterium Greene1014_49]
MFFSARIIPGSGLASKQRVPTLNLSLEEIPNDLAEGIYACRVSFDVISDAPAVMHYGLRPVHNLPRSCEVHLLERTIEHAPKSVIVKIIERIRDVQDFENAEQLTMAIRRDLVQARAILGA